MVELISCFLIAVALSMDTFSLSLGIGTYNITLKKCLKLSVIVGAMHFIMPLLGTIIGSSIISFFAINANRLLGGILLFIAGNLIWNYLKNETMEIDFKLMGMFLFSFGVSIDAFSTGLGLEAITQNKLMAMFIFSIVSCFFTMLGLSIGKFVSKHLGKKASILGIILLVTFGLFHLCQ